MLMHASANNLLLDRCQGISCPGGAVVMARAAQPPSAAQATALKTTAEPVCVRTHARVRTRDPQGEDM